MFGFPDKIEERVRESPNRREKYMIGLASRAGPWSRGGSLGPFLQGSSVGPEPEMHPTAGEKMMNRLLLGSLLLETPRSVEIHSLPVDVTSLPREKQPTLSCPPPKPPIPTIPTIHEVPEHPVFARFEAFKDLVDAEILYPFQFLDQWLATHEGWPQVVSRLVWDYVDFANGDSLWAVIWLRVDDFEKKLSQVRASSSSLGPTAALVAEHPTCSQYRSSKPFHPSGSAIMTLFRRLAFTNPHFCVEGCACPCPAGSSKISQLDSSLPSSSSSSMMMQSQTESQPSLLHVLHENVATRCLHPFQLQTILWMKTQEKEVKIFLDSEQYMQVHEFPNLIFDRAKNDIRPRANTSWTQASPSSSSDPLIRRSKRKLSPGFPTSSQKTKKAKVLPQTPTNHLQHKEGLSDPGSKPCKTTKSEGDWKTKSIKLKTKAKTKPEIIQKPLILFGYANHQLSLPWSLGRVMHTDEKGMSSTILYKAATEEGPWQKTSKRIQVSPQSIFRRGVELDIAKKLRFPHLRACQRHCLQCPTCKVTILEIVEEFQQEFKRNSPVAIVTPDLSIASLTAPSAATSSSSSPVSPLASSSSTSLGPSSTSLGPSSTSSGPSSTSLGFPSTLALSSGGGAGPPSSSITTLSFQGGGVLADDMGLGKTVQMLSLIYLDRRERNRVSSPKDPVIELNSISYLKTAATLLICPVHLVDHWKKEVVKWFGSSLKVLVRTQTTASVRLPPFSAFYPFFLLPPCLF